MLVDITQHKSYKTSSRDDSVSVDFPSHRQPSNLQSRQLAVRSSCLSAVEGSRVFLAAHPHAASGQCLLAASVCQDRPLSFYLQRKSSDYAYASVLLTCTLGPPPEILEI